MKRKRSPSTLSERTIRELARAGNLKLRRRRIKLLQPLFREFLANLKEMDDMDLGEEPLPLVLPVRRENDDEQKSSERTS